MLYIEDVFKTSGMPEFTFVQPPEYTKLLVALRTKGRSVIIEGPSGIGKTTCIQKAIDELGFRKDILILSARKREDIDLIAGLPDMGDDIGVVVIDDFHVLKNEIKSYLANYMKRLADDENERCKVIAIGINKAGDSLVRFAEDLNNRIDTIKFESNPYEKIIELINKGEKCLNIRFHNLSSLAKFAGNSFHITQMICKEACIVEGVTQEQANIRVINVPIEVVRDKLIDELGRVFYPVARDFSTGSKIRPEGRAPYFHLLNWLSESKDWSINIPDELLKHPEFKGSINQIVDKGFLERHISTNEHIKKVIHYDKDSSILSIEDPKFLFFLRNILWSKLGKQLGFINIDVKSKYDFALSFAGERRSIAKTIFEKLIDYEVEVFFDENEQARMLSKNIEDYLAPIYQSEAKYIIVILSKEYPQKIWTKFESSQFKHRFGDGSIIPIFFTDIDYSVFDESRKYSGITIDLDKPIDVQLDSFVTIVIKKLREDK